MKNLKCLLVSLILINTLHSQSQITVTLRQPPPYQFKVEDFWKVTLHNTTQNTYNVYLYGIATKTGEGKIVDANTSKFQLPPGTRIVQPKDISPINIIDKKKAYEDAIKFTGGLPTGDYEICLTVYNADNNEILGEECLSHSVEIISGIELLLPENKASVIFGGWKEDEDIDMDLVKKVGKKRDIDYSDNLYVNGSFITFSWLAPSPAPRGGSLTFSLIITEIYGRQSAYDALKSNPAFFKVNNIGSTVYQYSNLARNFSSDKRYAWQVTAYLNGVKMTESEVNEFEYTGWKPPPEKEEWDDDLDLGYNQNSLTAGSNTLQLKKSESLFRFNGNAKIFGESSNMQGIGSELPQRYMNFELTPSLYIKNIPFSIPILFSTLNRDSLQNINSFAFTFDPATLKDIIRKKVEGEIEKVKDQIEQTVKEKSDSYRKQLENKIWGLIPDSLKNLDDKTKQQIEQKISLQESEYKNQAEGKIKKNTLSNLSGLMKFFTYFHSLSLGTTYPVYTQNTINGISVTGGDIEFNPGIFYTAFTGFGNQKAIENSAYKRNLFAGRIGVGKKDKNHFIMTLMHAVDNENSIIVDSSNLTLTPKENWLVGFDGKLNLLKDKLSFETEGVLSMLTRDVRDPDIISEAIPGWVKNLFKPKGSSSVDYMYSGKLLFDNSKTNTKITGEIKMIGPGFTTLGNPTLRNDKFGFEGKIDQKFMDNRISTMVHLRSYKDNLINTKTTTTTVTSIIFRLGTRFKGYPTLNITFMPNFQKNDKQISTTDSSKIDNKTILFSGISGYSFKLGDINTHTSILFAYNNSKTLFGIYDYWSKTSMLIETFSFHFPLSVSTSIGMVQTLLGNYNYSRNITFALTGNFTFKDIWQNGAGIDISTDKSRSNRLGIYLNSNILIAKIITLDIRAEHIQYSDKLISSNNYKNFTLTSTLSANW